VRPGLLALLACADCGADFHVVDAAERDGEIVRGTLACGRCARRYAIADFVPRFAPGENYAEGFGLQWNRFRTTQLDSRTGRPISRDRFFRQTGWRPEDLAGRRVLDVGCGAGRFAEVALAAGAEVVAVDYSAAVDACRANLGPHPRLDVVQADVYRLPFRPGVFDVVYCFGVLQHTPDARRAFLALPPLLMPAGRLAVDVYPRRPLNLLWPKYWLRPITKGLPPARLFGLVEAMVRVLWPVSLALGRVPCVGRKLRHALPIANYEGIHPLSPAQLREWALLDTFDMLAPAHDHPQSEATVAEWFGAAGLRDVEVFRAGVVVGRGVR
jgi:SAM-dependent methyltransferase